MTDRNDKFSKRTASIALVLLVAVSGLGIGIGPAIAQDTPTEPTVDVAIDDSGTVDLTIVMTYDLSEASEQEAFEDLRTDDALLEEMETRFSERMDRVAMATAALTNRSPEVTAVDVSLQTSDSTGIVELSATITGLVAIDDGTLTLAEPFASGFQTDRTLRITVPEGYDVDSVTPEPDDRSDGTLVWEPDRSLDGFELVASESGEATATSTPGMGLLAGGLAVLGASLYIRKR
ncbi:MAG: DUF4897 domain-containing protein [Halodesulfurarchaeum sp.]|nr:DUF4897 domain-containing protein [Halodesulfurarchaeum sp.]